MNKRFKFLSFSILSLVVGLGLLKKYFELKELLFDGAGIGIYLGFIEINDRVPNGQVSAYANIFLFISLLFFVVFLYNLYKTVSQKNAD